MNKFFTKTTRHNKNGNYIGNGQAADAADFLGWIVDILGRSTTLTGFLPLDGTSTGLSRVTYSALFNHLTNPQTITVTIASPAVVSLTSHGFVAGERITFKTTGALPTGIVANVYYYVLSTSLTSNTFKIALSPEGTVVNTSGSQSGTHTVYAMSAVGKGDGSTTWDLTKTSGRMRLTMGQTTDSLAFEPAARSSNTIAIPNFTFPSQGQKVQLTTTGGLPSGLATVTDYWIIRVSSTSISFASTQANANAAVPITLSSAGTGVHTMTFTGVSNTIVGQTLGEETHGQAITEIAGHTHTIWGAQGTATNGTANSGRWVDFNSSFTGATGATGGDIQANNMPPALIVRSFIKY